MADPPPPPPEKEEAATAPAATSTAAAATTTTTKSTLVDGEPHHEPHPLSERPVKPALKKDGRDFSNTQPNANAKNLKWDEVAIEEHDLLRGTRMKIDEPNTPYTHYDSGSETDGSSSKGGPKSPSSTSSKHHTLSWDTLQTKLDSVAAGRDAYPSSPSSHGGDDAAEEHRRKELKALEFKEHRKRHYNEMELVRKYRQEHANDEAEDADDEND